MGDSLLMAMLSLAVAQAEPVVDPEAADEVAVDKALPSAEEDSSARMPGAAPTHEALSNALSYIFVPGQLVTVGSGPGIRITATNQLPAPNWGYTPLRFIIDNSRGPADEVLLSFTSNQGASRTFSKKVRIEPGARFETVLPIPAHVRYGMVRVRGASITEPNDASCYFNIVNRPQLAVLNIGTEQKFEQLAAVRPGYSGSFAQVVTLSPAAAPTELAAYLGQDAIVVSSSFIELSEAQRHALEAYASLGGRLIVAQSARGLGPSLPLLTDEPLPGRPHRYGLGSVAFCDDCTKYQVYELVKAVESPVLPTAFDSNRYRSYYAQYDSTNGTRTMLLQVAKAPVGRFMLIIAIFTLAIGPGSVWVARRRGTAMLLVTIPSTALITCVAIVGYSLAADGFTVHASVHGLTLLDSKNHRAVTAGVGAFYANLSPSSARFGPGEVLVAPVQAQYEPQQQVASLTWGEGLLLGADFIPSRTYREWGMVAAVPSRARLVVKANGPTVLVQNALESTITQAWVNVGGQLYRVGGLANGQQEAALPVKATEEEAIISALAGRLSPVGLDLVGRTPTDGHFIAILDGPGFTPLGGISVEHDDSHHVVVGEVER